MAKIITTDFGAIHDALNNLIIAEVKAALELLPDKMMEGASLCRIVVSDAGDYNPKDVVVDYVWLNDGQLCFNGHIMPPDWQDPNIEPEEYEGGEEECTDWLDITDFHYLIEQIADRLEGDKTYDVHRRLEWTSSFLSVAQKNALVNGLNALIGLYSGMGKGFWSDQAKLCKELRARVEKEF